MLLLLLLLLLRLLLLRLLLLLVLLLLLLMLLHLLSKNAATTPPFTAFHCLSSWVCPLQCEELRFDDRRLGAASLPAFHRGTAPPLYLQ